MDEQLGILKSLCGNMIMNDVELAKILLQFEGDVELAANFILDQKAAANTTLELTTKQPTMPKSMRQATPIKPTYTKPVSLIQKKDLKPLPVVNQKKFDSNPPIKKPVESSFSSSSISSKKMKGIVRKPQNFNTASSSSSPHPSSTSIALQENFHLEQLEEFLKTMFPELKEEVINESTKEHGLNAEKCVDYLLTKSRENVEGKKINRKPSKDGNKPTLSQEDSTICIICGVDYMAILNEEDRETIYKKHRSIVKKAIKQREKLFRDSARSYSENRKVEAANLLKQANQQNALIEELSEKVANEIFRHYNLKFADEMTKLDTHGLHAEEAVYYVMERLEFLRPFDVSELIVITGIGSHSLGREVVRPSIISALQSENYYFDQRVAGQIVIRVKH